MKNRVPVKPSLDKKVFHRTAKSVKKANLPNLIARGGIRF